MDLHTHHLHPKWKDYLHWQLIFKIRNPDEIKLIEEEIKKLIQIGAIEPSVSNY